MRLFDAHCHLQDSRILDLEEVLARARSSGVTGMVCCGTQESDWEAVLAIADTHHDVKAMLGLHPWYVQEASPHWHKSLEDLLAGSSAAVGECGLDFAPGMADLPLQEAAFSHQVRMAQRLQRPLAIHCRKAWARLKPLLMDQKPIPKAMVHACSASWETLQEFHDLDLYYSFACTLANPSNKRARKAITAVPLNRLLLETDSPSLSPQGPLGLNEPSHVRTALQAAADILGIPEETLSDMVLENALRLFRT